LVRAVQIEDLSRDGDVHRRELSSEKGSEHVRRDIKIALERIRRDMDHARRDLASASKNWVDTTSKFVQDNAPKVSATIDETLEKTSETFKRTMNTIDSETKTQQVKLLRAYKSFLSKQVDVIDKRLKRIKE
jgi:hypothetical protein